MVAFILKMNSYGIGTMEHSDNFVKNSNNFKMIPMLM